MKKKDDMKPDKSLTDPKNIMSNVTVNKKQLAYERKKIKDEDETEVFVVIPLDEETFMPPIGDAIPNSVKSLFKHYLEGDMPDEELVLRLKKLKVSPHSAASKLWLKKVIAHYFYGTNFKKLNDAINRM